MRYGFIITGGPVHEQVALAQEAEAAGWDGVFTWDGIHVSPDLDTYDPWVLLAAFATVTQRVRLGAIITPLSRRRPWKVAREATTLDHLSRGRLVLAVGLGALDDAGFGGVGEATERRVRAERLDESLQILAGLWSGQPFAFDGRHFKVETMTFRPAPLQRPRIPVWVVGGWPAERSMQRALRYDGLLPNVIGSPGSRPTPAMLAEMRDWISARRDLDRFDIVVEGTTAPSGSLDEIAEWRAAGATWWMEADWSTHDVDAMRRRVQAGPPRSPADL